MIAAVFFAVGLSASSGDGAVLTLPIFTIYGLIGWTSVAYRRRHGVPPPINSMNIAGAIILHTAIVGACFFGLLMMFI